MLALPYTPLHRLALATGVPADTPGLALASRTASSIVLDYTAPANQTNYATGKVKLAVDGAAPSATQSQVADGQVTFSGLTPGTRYVAFAASVGAGGEELSASEVVTVDLPPTATGSRIAQIKAAIRALIVGVAGVTASTVHARRRLPVGADTTTLQSLFEVSGAVDAWVIEEESLSDSRWLGIDTAWENRSSTFTIQTWREWDDSGNAIDAHRAVVEDVIEALNGDHTLDGTVDIHSPVTVRVAGEINETLAGRRCHYVELALTCTWLHEKP